MKSSDIHIRAISQEIPQLSITKIHLKIPYLKFHTNFPGANELIIQCFHYKMVQYSYHSPAIATWRRVCIREGVVTNPPQRTTQTPHSTNSVVLATRCCASWPISSATATTGCESWEDLLPTHPRGCQSCWIIRHTMWVTGMNWCNSPTTSSANRF